MMTQLTVPDISRSPMPRSTHTHTRAHVAMKHSSTGYLIEAIKAPVKINSQRFISQVHYAKKYFGKIHFETNRQNDTPFLTFALLSSSSSSFPSSLYHHFLHLNHHIYHLHLHNLHHQNHLHHLHQYLHSPESHMSSRVNISQSVTH